MHKSLLDILVDPIAKTPLRVQEHGIEAASDIVEGVLLSLIHI